jgi:hypothetical protein
MTYNSAHDLPSFVELSKQLNDLKPLSFLLPKDQRGEFAKLEAQLKEMADTVDDFYTLLGGLCCKKMRKTKEAYGIPLSVPFRLPFQRVC